MNRQGNTETGFYEKSKKWLFTRYRKKKLIKMVMTATEEQLEALQIVLFED